MSEPTQFPTESATASEAAVLVERGQDLLLRRTQPAEAAGTFAQALQLDPQFVAAHLGMAEANFALGAFPIALQAAQYVQQIAPATPDADLANAIELVLTRRYPEALAALDRITRADPGKPYPHALRGHVLRQMHQDYDAALAEAKAARLASSSDIRHLFPRVEPRPAPVATVDSAPNGVTARPQDQWTPPSPIRRRIIRFNFITSRYPLGTYGIMLFLTVMYLVNLITKDGLANAAFQDNFLALNGEPWRIVTAIFLQDQANFVGLAFSLLSLYFIGTILERIYGLGRFLAIFLLAGIVSGYVYAVVVPDGAWIGPTGAIAGIFGALGAFFFAYRSQLGPVAGTFLNQWALWLGLNVVLTLYGGSGGWQLEVAGLVAGMILGLALAPRRN